MTRRPSSGWSRPGRFSIERGLILPGVAPWAQELAEAYVRVGDPAAATRVLATLEQHATRSDALLAHAAVARCRGLMAGEVEAELHFVRALALHDQRDAPFERARTELCFGERLRRGGHRTEAREHLRRALATFDALGAQPWSEHASRELNATGERARRRAPDTAAKLTPQELQVALLVADGATNKEAAAALFVSPKTIEAHLLRVYRKLGLHSRSELARRMLTPGTAAGAGSASAHPPRGLPPPVVGDQALVVDAVAAEAARSTPPSHSGLDGELRSVQ